MKKICFYFQVHQPFRLKKYRFFDIGKDHNYFDEESNSHIMQKVARKCYLPVNKIFLDLIKEYDDVFKISFSISGTALEQFEMYAPEVLDSFKELAETGCVEFLSETYSHSLVSLKNKDEFVKQVMEHDEKIEKYFGCKPQVFRNTELIYSDEIGKMAADMGFKAILTEGTASVLDWRSPNYLYSSAKAPDLKVLLKNYKLSDDIAFRYSDQTWSEWPLTTSKFVHWLNMLENDAEIVNLFMDYETFGEHQWEATGIFDFLKSLPGQVLEHTPFTFATPSDIVADFKPVGSIHVSEPISWADEERDLTTWLGNELQDEAFDKLYSLLESVKESNDPVLMRDWELLQTSDHFYYMCTKWFADGDVHKYFNPYQTPYDAFINFMNILSDLEGRVDKTSPLGKRRDQVIYLAPSELSV